MSIYTFQDKTKNFTLSVKTDMLATCSNPENFDVYELNAKYYMFKYLHNPTAPAVIRHDNGRESWWIDGLNIGEYVKGKTENEAGFMQGEAAYDPKYKEQLDKLIHQYNFNKRLQNELSD